MAVVVLKQDQEEVMKKDLRSQTMVCVLYEFLCFFMQGGQGRKWLW